MMKRILAGAAAAGLVTTLLMSGPAGAAPCNTTGDPSDTPQDGKGHEILVVPVTESRVYQGPDEPGSLPGTTGFIGVQGSTGWIEAGGSATPAKGHIAGNADAAPVDGRISGSEEPRLDVCAAETHVL